MLKPLKDLLTYLQRNANSSNIFGLTAAAITTATTMGPNENPRLEETMIASSEDLGLEDTDPLHDPLALDDCPVADANVSGTSIGSEDDEGIASGKIILVDVTTLKPKEAQDELETDDDDDEPMEKQNVSFVVEDGEQPAEKVVHLSNGSCGPVESVSSIQDDVVTVVVDEDEIIEIDSALSIAGNVHDIIPGIVEDGFRLSPSTIEDEEVDGEVLISKTPILNGHYPAHADTLDGETVEQTERNAVEATVEQIQGANGEEEEEASDGSDSGLGLEPSRSVAAGSSASSSNSSSSSPLQRPPIKSSLKRRSEPIEITADGGAVAQQEKEDGVSSQKRPKKGITFDGVTVYYFPRIQGFGCVPSQGGCTLGMEYQHVHSRRLTLSEHSAEQRKVHRQQLQELNPRSSSSDDDSSSEEEPIDSCSEAESESYGFLQPVSTRQRRALLKAAGVRKIDPTEKDDCREIRTSREVCGCTCRGFCHPDRCACSIAGIKCQVDRPNFPCGCTHEGCANTAGRVEFNPGRVRTHYMHTIMRLSMEDTGSGGKGTFGSGSGGSVPDGTVVRPGTSAGAIGGVVSSDKAWSNSSVRLPPGMVVYPDSATTAPPDRAVEEELDVMLDPVKGILYHFHSQSNLQPHDLPPQHQPIGQQQQQESLSHVSQQGVPYHHHHHHHPHQQTHHAPLSRHSGEGPSHQNYSPSNISHLLGSASATESLDLQYAFRDYYPAGDGGGGSAVDPACSSSVPMLYRGNYDSYDEGETPLEHYRELPLHVPDPASIIAARQHMLTTGHDRHMERTSFVPGLSQQTAVDQTELHRIVPPPQVPQAELVTPMEPLFPSAPPPPSAIDIEVEEPDENCDPDVTVISDSSIFTIDLDTSGGEVSIEECEQSDFIDLTAPQADNTERLEAINDLLKSSRRSVSIVRRSIVAEEDDELRDFQHPPVEPSPPSQQQLQKNLTRMENEEVEVVEKVDDDDDDEDDENNDVRVSSAHTVSRNDCQDELRNGGGDGTLRNGHAKEEELAPLPPSSPQQQQQQQQNKRMRYSTIENMPASCSLILTNGSDIVSSTSSSVLLPDVASMSSSRDVTALETSENLCEIIKNSIVETAVTH
uniref:CSRNP_N domain-containing protein n=1 Tax=Anopheles dirus TaxID=7168 RepID=A0A1Y9H1Z9_9DIPT